MKLLRLALVSGALWAAIPAAEACGVCVEDKVAATYDHAVVMGAMERKQVVVFAAAEGGARAEDSARAMKAAALRVRGVQRGSVRAAPAPLTLSFALDPGVRTPEDALAAVARAVPGVKLALLRVMR